MPAIRNCSSGRAAPTVGEPASENAKTPDVLAVPTGDDRNRTGVHGFAGISGDVILALWSAFYTRLFVPNALRSAEFGTKFGTKFA